MRVLLYTNHTPLTRHLPGGAHQLVHDLLEGLVAREVEVDVLCPASPRADVLDLRPRLRVLPVLKEARDRDPIPYERQLNLQWAARLAAKADVIVTVDRSFPLPCTAPVVLLLFNFSYPDCVDAVFTFTWDSAVVPSDYLRRCVQAVAGPVFWPGGERPVVRAVPGIDTRHFRRRSGEEVAALRVALGLPDGGRYLVFPHRLDPRKGHETALHLVRELRARGHDHTLLLPAQPETGPQARYLAGLRETVRAQGLEAAVVLHPWITNDLMPAYYSLAEQCLMLSTMPEGAIPLTVLQAVSCGTPVIATQAGAARSAFPPGHGVDLVELGPAEAIVARAVAAVLRPRDDAALRRGRALVADRHALPGYVDAVLDHLRMATKRAGGYDPCVPRPVEPSPWCHPLDETTVWHDYLMRPVAADGTAAVPGWTADDRDLLAGGLATGPLPGSV